MSLHSRIAAALGWSERDVRSFSMPTLREMVRLRDPALAHEISEHIRHGRGYVVEGPDGAPLATARTRVAAHRATRRRGAVGGGVNRAAGKDYEIIARRRSSDGKRVDFWSDGTVTVGMAYHVVARSLPRDVLWIVADEVSLYDADEVKRLVAAARKALDKHRREPHRVRREDLLRLTRVYANVEKRSAGSGGPIGGGSGQPVGRVENWPRSEPLRPVVSRKPGERPAGFPRSLPWNEARNRAGATTPDRHEPQRSRHRKWTAYIMENGYRDDGAFEHRPGTFTRREAEAEAWRIMADEDAYYAQRPRAYEGFDEDLPSDATGRL